jgi:very-short-patch-repair endonuclease
MNFKNKNHKNHIAEGAATPAPKGEAAHTMHYGAPPTTFDNARILRNKLTPAEQLLWEVLKDRKIAGAKFRKQHAILRYVLDFYCHEYKIGIEVDGEYHNEREQYELDLERTKHLKENNITIIRFTNEEVFNKLNFVTNSIETLILNIRLSAATPAPKGEAAHGEQAVYAPLEVVGKNGNKEL